MWAIGFLIVLYVYVFLVKLIASAFPDRIKTIIYGLSFFIPLSYPFLYNLYPSYHQFNNLCNKSQRDEVFKSISVDSFFASSYQEGYQALLDKRYISFVYRSKSYARGKNWKSSQCLNLCAKAFTFKEIGQCMLDGCIRVSEVSEAGKFIEYKNDYETIDSIDIFNSTLRHSITKLVTEEYGVLAEQHDYTYYPYGTGWARILGLDSGSAPSFRCEKFSRFRYYEIFHPNKNI